jgi:DNA-binding transcriptional LysR family regulator
MADDISLVQLRVFVACARTGSFSAVARELGRTQSMISCAIARFEERLGVMLFDRSSRLPQLTDEGRALLVHAQAIMQRVDELKACASSYAAGTEAELSIALDAMLPVQSLTRAVGSFREKFPSVQLHVHVEPPGAVAELVSTRRCRIGVLGPLPDPSEALVVEPILNVAAVALVSATHALADHPGRVPRSLVDKEVQVADLQVKREFLCAGFGWGCMPRHLVEHDLATGRLVQIEVEGMPCEKLSIQLSSVYRRDLPPGPAAQWLLDQLVSDSLA